MLMDLAGELALVGKCDQAKANAKAAINLLRGQTNLAKGAGVYAACDDLSQAQSLIDEAAPLIRRTRLLVRWRLR